MSQDKKNLILIALLSVLAWFPTLNFWFFKAYEATWLTGIAPYNLVNLIKGHAFLYYLDWKLFGWNPWGWYLTALIVHAMASLFFYKFVLTVSKKRNLALVSSLIFTVTTAYNDVLTWGSFNSYYPLLLICFLVCLITFFKFKENKSRKLLAVSLIAAFLGFYVRETGIVIIPLVFALDIFFTKNILSRSEIIKLVRRQIPFVLIILLFFMIRTLYGGTPGDSADSNVKLQMRFMSDGLYFEYAKAALLTFGKLIPPQIIPYEILNYLRELGSKFIFYEFMNTYFFPIIGWVVLGVFGFIALRLRKSKTYFRIFMFFLVWVGLFSLFVSLAVPNTPEVLSRAYEYNTMRYRYFAFLGTSVILAIILVNYIKKAKLLNLVMIFVVMLNLLFIWKIERDVYADFYKPAKEFYVKFNSIFPSLPTKTTFYLYPHAPALGDYLLEWFTIKDKKYENLISEPFRVESQIIAVLNKVQSGKLNLDDVVFLDYTKEKGLVNETEKVKNILRNQKEYKLSPEKLSKNNYRASVKEALPVELPYNSNLSVSLTHSDFSKGSSPDSEKFRALIDYSVNRNNYLKNSKVTTAYTVSQREGEPFFHALPKHLTDGNLGIRSNWIADHWAPWIQVDLGEEKEVSAVLWGSQEVSTRIPATYTISVSTDAKNWTKVIDVKNSTSSNKIEVFKSPVNTRYVRIDIKTTSGGDFVLIDEFEVVTEEGKSVLSYYKNRDDLFYDAMNLFMYLETSDDLAYAEKLNTYHGKLSWDTSESTSSQNGQITYFSYAANLDSQNISVEIPESEIFAGVGLFLKKNITSISVDFLEAPSEIIINNLTLTPRISVGK